MLDMYPTEDKDMTYLTYLLFDSLQFLVLNWSFTEVWGHGQMRKHTCYEEKHYCGCLRFCQAMF